MDLLTLCQELLTGTQRLLGFNPYPSGKSTCVKKSTFQEFLLEADQTLKAT